MTIYAKRSLTPAGTPTIITQPQNVTMTYGTEGQSISVAATAAEGTTLTYQWYRINDGDEPFTQAAVLSVGNGAITYQSSDDKVAAVNKTTGAVTIHSAGTAVIPATAAASDDYEMGTVRYRKSLFSSAVSKSI